MQDAAVDALASDGCVVVDAWLGRVRALSLRHELDSLMELGRFAAARVGTGARRHEATDVRRDSICWFDADARPDADDGRFGIRPGPQVGLFLERMDLLRQHLNRTCFLRLGAIECHAACYEPGGFYRSHLDSPSADSPRIISFSYYLSERRGEDRGGCLRIHREGRKGSEAPDPVDIEPHFDRLVVFQSRRIRHEVMPVAARRYSMTGWMSEKSAA